MKGRLSSKSEIQPNVNGCILAPMVIFTCSAITKKLDRQLLHGAIGKWSCFDVLYAWYIATDDAENYCQFFFFSLMSIIVSSFDVVEIRFRTT